MWITKIQLQNIRGFEDETIELSKGINLLVGPNNSGKSTIAYSALPIQTGFPLNPTYLRSGAKDGNLKIHLKDASDYFSDVKQGFSLDLTFHITKTGQSGLIARYGSNETNSLRPIEPIEPLNFIYPYLSKRRVGSYNEDVRAQYTSAVTGTLQHLYAKIDKISNPQLPAHKLYEETCKQILGFVVTCTSSPNGKKACYVLDDFASITIDNMGEGVSSILGLLVDLCVAKNKLFVIEEPETDIHPTALKGLLKLIVNKSSDNQFIITTHSNIVTRFLGAETETRIFKVDMQFKENIPTSKIEKIENNSEARQDLLAQLGYELTDFDLWEAWLFLEEASAEKIVREHLIPWFFKELQGKLRTFSARSVDQVEPKFDDFNRLFAYLNLEPTYKNRAWVIIDEGPKEKVIIDRLKATYCPNGWSEDHFKQFSMHDFENYYPEPFKEEVAKTLLITDRKQKGDRKISLLHEVESWISNNPEKAKDAFQNSAREVIQKLATLSNEIIARPKE